MLSDEGVAEDGVSKIITEEGTPNFCSWTSSNNQYDEFFHITFGEQLVKRDTSMVYCGLFDEAHKIRVVIYCGALTHKNAGEIAREVSKILGGAGGGNQIFAQGGGPDKSKIEDAVAKAESMVFE